MAKVTQLVSAFNKEFKAEIARQGLVWDAIDRIPTGWFELDLQLGGGFPIGRVSEIYGMEASMKTTIALKIIAHAQRMWPDKIPIFIDVEGHLDHGWAKKMGVDISPDRIIHALPDNTEQCIDMIEGFAMAEDVSVIVLDSIAAMVTQAELNKSAEDTIVGNSGLAANKLYRRLGSALGKQRREGMNRPTVIFINQIRSKVGVMFGSNETTPGGNSFKFIASLRLRTYGKDVFKKKDDPMPTHREIGVMVKKYKIPIVNAKGSVKVGLFNSEDGKIRLGESDFWNPLYYYLCDLSMFMKSATGGGYDLIDTETGAVEEHFKTVTEFREKALADEEYSTMLQNRVFAQMLGNDGDLIVQE